MNPVDLADEQRAKQTGSKMLMLSTGSSPESSEQEDVDEEEEEEEEVEGDEEEDRVEETTNQVNASINQEDQDLEGDEGEPSFALSCNYQQSDHHLQSRSSHLPLARAQKVQEITNEQFINHHHHHQQQQQLNHHINQQHQQKDYEDVKQVELFGVSIVALTINSKERLCLAQISNTLLKEFSYNEIHNRRVALGITCVQCTPIQLEMLRRAGAMPSSSRRCGMITMREAERLCRSFLVEEQPPELPENFYFTVAHRVNYGCKGRFVPARYISSRAKCIECFYCGEFYSPNKFIFHSHRQPHTTDCNPPDSPNINSWRKHIDLDWSQEHSQEIKYAWEDVKSLFNGGTRRRAPQSQMTTSSTTTSTESSSTLIASASASAAAATETVSKHSQLIAGNNQRRNIKNCEEDQLIIDVDDSTNKNYAKPSDVNVIKRSSNKASWASTAGLQSGRSGGGSKQRQQTSNSLMLNSSNNQQANRSPSVTTTMDFGSMKRPFEHQNQQQVCNKRLFNGGGSNMIQTSNKQLDVDSSSARERSFRGSVSPCSFQSLAPSTAIVARTRQQSLPFADFINSPAANRFPNLNETLTANNNNNNNNNQNNQQTQNKTLNPLLYQNSPNFIYSQLYTQLMQQQPISQQQTSQQQQQQLNSTVDAQLALRHHLWSSLLANLQCNTTAGNQTYSLQQQQLQQQTQPSTNLGLCNQSAGDSTDLQSSANISHLLAAQLYQQQQQQLPQIINNGSKLNQRNNQTPLNHGYKNNQPTTFSIHKPFPAETSDL